MRKLFRRIKQFVYQAVTDFLAVREIRKQRGEKETVSAAREQSN